MAWQWARDDNGLDETDTRAVTKANFVPFYMSNEWPVSVKKGEFHLTVVGNERLHAELVDKYAMKLIGAQPLTIHGRPYRICPQKDFITLFTVMLEAPNSIAWRSPWQTPRPCWSPILSGGQGALINFVSIGNRIRYEINAADAAKKGVLIGNKIMTWAVK